MKLFLLSLSTIVSLSAGLGNIELSSFGTGNKISSFPTERCIVRSTSFYKDFGMVYKTLIKPQVAQYAFGTELNKTETSHLNCYTIKIALGACIALSSICPRYFGYQWTIENREKKEFIGIISARCIIQKDAKKYIEIGCILHPAYQAQGYAKEVGQALFAIFEQNKNFSADALICNIHEKNIASRKLVEKMGFEYLGQKCVEKPFSLQKGTTCLYAKYLKDSSKNK